MTDSGSDDDYYCFLCGVHPLTESDANRALEEANRELEDLALVYQVIRDCPHRLAKASPECRLPGWFPRAPTPPHLWLALPQITLSVHKMSGHKCAEVQVNESDFFPDGRPRGCREDIFKAMVADDPWFPIQSKGFLQFIQFTPKEMAIESFAATCTVVFPAIEFVDWYNPWRGVPDPWTGTILGGETGKIYLDNYADPETLLVGFYLARDHEQHASLARIIANSGLSCLYEPPFVSAALAIFSNQRFSAVNYMKETYKGIEHDTTLWHLLLDKSKRWNYPEFSKIFQCLLSRHDLDLSYSGWSWAMGCTTSATELCFFEWSAMVGKNPKRKLWVDSTIPRLCLLSACLHVRERDPHGSVVQMCQQLHELIDKERHVLKQSKALKKLLMQDLELLGSEDLFSLPWFLKSEDVFGLISLLKQ